MTKQTHAAKRKAPSAKLSRRGRERRTGFEPATPSLGSFGAAVCLACNILDGACITHATPLPPTEQADDCFACNILGAGCSYHRAMAVEQ